VGATSWLTLGFDAVAAVVLCAADRSADATLVELPVALVSLEAGPLAIFPPAADSLATASLAEGPAAAELFAGGAWLTPG